MSVIILPTAVSPEPSAQRTNIDSSPAIHPAPEHGDAHSIDGDVFGAPHPSEPTNSDHSPSQESTYKNQPPVQKAKSTILRWWWREIFALIFNITSMALVLVLVLKINNTALGSWNFQIGSLAIQPNTPISILTTIGKTLMMVPVTACLGQLKWRCFCHARHLHHMQLMDDASRGPWGSLLLLFPLGIHEGCYSVPPCPGHHCSIGYWSQRATNLGFKTFTGTPQ